MSNRAITQRDVARAAGISQETVSQALRGVGRLSDETRQRVLSVARDLGYQRNTLATAVRQGRTCTIALLTTTQDGIGLLPHEMLKAIEHYLSEQQQFLSICALPPGYPDDLSAAPEALRKVTADGMLININYGITDDLMVHVDRYAPPSIWLNAKLERNAVYPDEYGIFADVTAYLAEHGVQHIHYLNKQPTYRAVIPHGHYSETDRRDGYRHTAERLGLHPNVVDAEGLTTDLLLDLVQRGAGQRVALLCYERNEALRAMLAATEAGLSLPDQVIIIYPSERPFYDRMIDSKIRHLPIPEAKVAKAALQALQSRIDEPKLDLPAQAIPYAPKYLATLLDRSLHYAR